jgi:nucleotidyltransferase/DNA polymerase involved in DNA repair
MDYEAIAKAIKDTLQRELDITFSVGLSCTKVLAKVGSKYAKPNGFTPIRLVEKDIYLRNTAIGKIWGIGPNTAQLLTKYGVLTAFDFIQKDEAWVRRLVTKPILEIWKELQGESVYDLVTEKKDTYHSIQKTKTFTPHSNDSTFLYSQLSKNIEAACEKARRHHLGASGFSFFLKSDSFRYRGCDVKLPKATNSPHEILEGLQAHFMKVFQKGVYYRATGVTLTGLGAEHITQLDLFSDQKQTEGIARLFENVDTLTERYGRNAIYLGSSMKAVQASVRASTGRGIGSGSTKRRDAFLVGKDRNKVLSIPFLGEVN